MDLWNVTKAKLGAILIGSNYQDLSRRSKLWRAAALLIKPLVKCANENETKKKKVLSMYMEIGTAQREPCILFNQGTVHH